MNDFIPTIRTDRYREIKLYKEKKFKFVDENKYMLIEKVLINNDICYEFEVRVDFSEIRFYIIKDGASLYLTIYQLYELLIQVRDEKKIDIIYHLKHYIRGKKKEKFIYKNVEYKMQKFRKFKSNYIVSIADSNLHITYNELFYLLVFIQEKSNYLFSLSKKKKEYTNGLIRLLIVLLELKNDDKLLKKLGWNFDKDRNIYKPNRLQKLNKNDKNSEKHNKNVERKYYLTREEMDSII